MLATAEKNSEDVQVPAYAQVSQWEGESGMRLLKQVPASESEPESPWFLIVQRGC
ncbi:hypothetical protein RISK_002636 [Rhodopirellula islandica]|uniref:Uncharacterized protein n=1 Tax=Rhodopirellula islandica TaxID=595434 RepID=A0A0J1BFA6_RHOIS|nr:hypothetical protein RISK_002636 [Rhodopirellula islandica]